MSRIVICISPKLNGGGCCYSGEHDDSAATNLKISKHKLADEDSDEEETEETITKYIMNTAAKPLVSKGNL